MRISTLARLAVLPLVALTACGTDATATPSPTPTGQATPAVTIVGDAYAKSMESTFSFQAILRAGSEQVAVEGEVDPVAGARRIVKTSRLDVIEVVVVDGMVYVRHWDVDSEPWVSYELARLEEVNSAWEKPYDLSGQAAMFAGVESVTEVGPGRYEAVIDLRRAGRAVDDPEMTLLGSVASNGKELPVEVTIDSEGRLTRTFFVLEVGAQKLETELIIDDFGLPVEIVAPEAALVVEATDEMYLEPV